MTNSEYREMDNLKISFLRLTQNKKISLLIIGIFLSSIVLRKISEQFRMIPDLSLKRIIFGFSLTLPLFYIF